MSEPTGGRPRDLSIDERVLLAARELLVEVGWDDTSIRGIAERAGVSRPAIARRWPSKAHLVLDAILGPTPDLVHFTDVDRDGWIRAVVDGSFELFNRPEVRAAAPGLLATLRDHDDIRSALWQGFTRPAAKILTDLAGDEGPAAAEAERAAQAVIALAAGAALFASLIVADDAQPDLADLIAGTLERGLPAP